MYYWKDPGIATIFFFGTEGKYPKDREWDIGGQYMYIEKEHTSAD